MDIREVLHNYHDGEAARHLMNPTNRMKPLDVLKILMGIFSSRESVKRYQYDGKFWAKLNEYDYA